MPCILQFQSWNVLPNSQVETELTDFYNLAVTWHMIIIYFQNNIYLFKKRPETEIEVLFLLMISSPICLKSSPNFL